MKKIAWILGVIAATVIGWIYRAKIMRQITACARRDNLLDETTMVLSDLRRAQADEASRRLHTEYVRLFDQYQGLRAEIAVRHAKICKLKERLGKVRSWGDL